MVLVGLPISIQSSVFKGCVEPSFILSHKQAPNGRTRESVTVIKKDQRRRERRSPERERAFVVLPMTKRTLKQQMRERERE